jgi:hypothetical protein
MQSLVSLAVAITQIGNNFGYPHRWPNVSQLRGTIILAELPNLLAIAVTSDTWRVERLFNNVSLLTCFMIH